MVSDDLQATYDNLERYIFGEIENGEPSATAPGDSIKESEVLTTEVEMENGAAEEEPPTVKPTVAEGVTSAMDVDPAAQVDDPPPATEAVDTVESEEIPK